MLDTGVLLFSMGIDDDDDDDDDGRVYALNWHVCM